MSGSASIRPPLGNIENMGQLLAELKTSIDSMQETIKNNNEQTQKEFKNVHKQLATIDTKVDKLLVHTPTTNLHKVPIVGLHTDAESHAVTQSARSVFTEVSVTLEDDKKTNYLVGSAHCSFRPTTVIPAQQPSLPRNQFVFVRFPKATASRNPKGIRILGEFSEVLKQNANGRRFFKAETDIIFIELDAPKDGVQPVELDLTTDVWEYIEKKQKKERYHVAGETLNSFIHSYPITAVANETNGRYFAFVEDSKTESGNSGALMFVQSESSPGMPTAIGCFKGAIDGESKAPKRRLHITPLPAWQGLKEYQFLPDEHCQEVLEIQTDLGLFVKHSEEPFKWVRKDGEEHVIYGSFCRGLDQVYDFGMAGDSSDSFNEDDGDFSDLPSCSSTDDPQPPHAVGAAARSWFGLDFGGHMASAVVVALAAAAGGLAVSGGHLASAIRIALAAAAFALAVLLAFRKTSKSQ